MAVTKNWTRMRLEGSIELSSRGCKPEFGSRLDILMLSLPEMPPARHYHNIWEGLEVHWTRCMCIIASFSPIVTLCSGTSFSSMPHNDRHLQRKMWIISCAVSAIRTFRFRFCTMPLFLPTNYCCSGSVVGLTLKRYGVQSPSERQDFFFAWKNYPGRMG